MTIRTIRGAITTQNDRKSILQDTKSMLESIMLANNIKIENIIAILFTTTKDITKAYPAIAARTLGVVDASLMCMQEMYVEDSLENCVRCMLTIETNKDQKEMNHIYMKEAKKLRPDLAKGGNIKC